MSLFLPSMYVQDNNEVASIVAERRCQLGGCVQVNIQSCSSTMIRISPFTDSYLVNNLAAWSRDREETRSSDMLNLSRERVVTLLMSPRRPVT